VPLATAPEDLHACVRALPRMGFQGANVTVPHKQGVIDACDRLDDHARRLGAVNTLVFDGHTIEGRNTDGVGFINNLYQHAPGWDPAAGPAVVLGAGGAARAVVVALSDAGVPNVRIANRTREKADALAEQVGGRVRAIDWGDRSAALAEASLLVNTTSLGMTGKEPLEIDLDPLPLGALVNDIVYDPLTTDLLQRASDRGNPTVDGLGMLLHQAAPGFEAWFGVRPEVTEELREAVLRD
jgi:shikimate dehydrogenase